MKNTIYPFYKHSKLHPLRIKLGVLLLFLFLLLSCSRDYTFFVFTYPPNSEKQESGWKYLGKITVWNSVGKHSCEKAEKDIHISIVDESNTTIFEDKITLLASNIERKVAWNKLDEFTIDLFETACTSWTDSYNQKLKNKGPVKLITLKYTYKDNVFKRVE